MAESFIARTKIFFSVTAGVREKGICLFPAPFFFTVLFCQRGAYNRGINEEGEWTRMVNKKTISHLQQLIGKLPPALAGQLEALPESCWDSLQEIRLQEGREIWLIFPGKMLSIGQVIPNRKSVSREEIEQSFAALCDYSVHTFLPQIVYGFLTIQGGHRIGLGGTAVVQDGKVTSIRELSSLNIRLARKQDNPEEVEKIGRSLFEWGLCSVLIAGEPGSGKTTLLRTLAFLLSHRWRVTVVDERGEIVDRGLLPLGGCLDVLRGYPKPAGILQAVRTLSPQVVICDELGTLAETEQLLQAVNCGVRFVASIHAGSLEELFRRPQFQLLQKEKAFEKVLLLRGADLPGQAAGIFEIEDWERQVEG